MIKTIPPSRRLYQTAFALGILALFFAAPHAMASTSGGSMPWDSPLAQARNAATGPWAYTASIFGLIGAGAGLIFGSEFGAIMKTFLTTILIISFLVGANAIMATMFNTGAVV